MKFDFTSPRTLSMSKCGGGQRGRMKIRTSLILYLFLMFFNLSFAQPENPTIEEIQGKKYYVHFVQAGNTLYGLSKLYKLSAEELLNTNPSAVNGLQIGQKIIIPVERQVVQNTVEEIKAPETHTVLKSETLYGISRKYNVTLDELVRLNPGCENGLSVDQVLKLPTSARYSETQEKVMKTQVVFTDSTILYTVLPHETMYSISKRFMVSVDEIKSANNLSNEKIRKGDVLKIPAKKEQIKKIEVRKVEDIKINSVENEVFFKNKNKYNIIYFLPFNLDGNPDQQKSLATEFLMGAQLALDSLEMLGLNATIRVIDVNNDTTKFKQILTQKEVKNADLLIGPFTGKNLDVAARFAKQNHIRLISPLFPSTTILRDNLYVYNAINSDITLIEALATYVAKNKINENLVLVKPDGKDLDLYHAFQVKFKNLTAGKVKLVECSQNDLATFVKKSGKTILIVPSRDKVFASNFINNLAKSALKNANISIYSTKEWVNNDDIRGFYKNKYNIHFASPNDFSYTYPQTKSILRKYRTVYNTDLTKYSTQGFDITMFFLQEFYLNKPNSEGVMNKFKMKTLQSGSGYENKTCFILEQIDYDLKRVDVISE
jgi:LysM repeat protein/ABC-type branched-subunit amino acid transport system substrate-binding protein